MPNLKSCSALLPLAFAMAAAHAGAPLYHLTPLTVPDATSVTVEDINDVGQIVGTYNDANFVRHAVLWDAAGWHELALPPGDEVNGIARAINNAGQIVGTSDDFVQPTFGLLWTTGTPGTYTVLNNDSGAAVSPAATASSPAAGACRAAHSSGPRPTASSTTASRIRPCRTSRRAGPRSTTAES